jgi:hypothetical protein
MSFKQFISRFRAIQASVCTDGVIVTYTFETIKARDKFIEDVNNGGEALAWAK